MNYRNKSFSKLELIILFLIFCVFAFLALPIVNSYRVYKNPIVDSNLDETPIFIDKNDSNISSPVFPKTE
jgi:uncharacterized membrane protein